MGYIEGEDRNQITLFPEYMDDYVSEDNPVRFIDKADFRKDNRQALKNLFKDF